MRLLFDGLGLLDVGRHDHARDRSLRKGGAESAVDDVARLRGVGELLDVAGHVREQGLQVDLLLVAAAERRSRLLADDRDDRLVVELRVVEAVQEVDRAWARGRDADARLPGELRVTGGHERTHLLMAGLHPLDPLAGLAIEREDDAVDAVAWIAEDAADAPLTQASDDEVAHRATHRVGRRPAFPASRRARLRTVVAWIPQRYRRRGFVRHPLRVADQLDVGAERRAEVVDRLSGSGTLGHRERSEQLLDALRLHVRDRLVDVTDVEGDVLPAEVRVLPERPDLVGRRVLEELDARPVSASDLLDALDDGPRVHVEQILDEGPGRIAERPERQRGRAAEDGLEPPDRIRNDGDGDSDVVHSQQAGNGRADGVEPVALRRPQRPARISLVRHPLRVADELDVRPERGPEVVDRLARRRALGHGQRPEELLHALGLHVRGRGRDVLDVEGDVMTGPVRVLRKRPVLVRGVVLEELDVRAAPAAHHRDLLDHGARMDAEEVLHERAGRVGEGPEGQGRGAAHDVPEPRRRVVDVGDGEADVVHPDEAQLPYGDIRGRRRCARARDDARQGDGDEARDGNEDRAEAGPRHESDPLLWRASCQSGAARTREYDRAMEVRGLVWAGVRTDRFAETLTFFRDVLGLPLIEAAPDFAWSRLPDSSQFEIFGPGEGAHDHFTTGPVPEFLVDDLHAAADELEGAGIELLGPIHGTDEQAWLHFRAPDGNVYGLTSSASYRRPSEATRA